MAVSDTQMLNDLIARVERLEEQMAELRPKELHQELYGEPADHTEDRAGRAALVPRRPGQK
jgi:uncharacterized protein (UPF0335 family)